MSRFELVNEISQQARSAAGNVGAWEQLREQRIADAKALRGMIQQLADLVEQHEEITATALTLAERAAKGVTNEPV